ncbi:hypothetical protein ACR9E3_20140 [Actinomycetospora sp. C-140]
MIVRPARPLPSVIVGALLVGSLGLGAGSAAADPETCTAGGQRFEVARLLERAPDGQCLLGGVAALADSLVGLGYQVVTETTGTAEAARTATEQAASNAANTVDAAAGAGASAASPSSASVPSGAAAGTDGGASTDTSAGAVSGVGAVAGSQAPVAPASAVIPAPDVRGAPVAFAAAGGLATARVPMLSFGPANPALLFAPLGSPLRTLAGQGAGSPVTTSSDVQALAVDGLPGGVGTPTVLAVLVLASLGAFALRHAVLRRVRGDAGGS